MPHELNGDIAARLDEIGRMLAEQGANRFRVNAYHRAAALLRGLPQPVSAIFAAQGLDGLDALPGVGPRIAHAIADMLQHGQSQLLLRLRGDHDPIGLLTSVPGVGKALAWRLHDTLGIASLEALEAAAADGRLAQLPGLGPKRLAGIRDALAQRLGRVRTAQSTMPVRVPPVTELLAVDAAYRQAAAAGKLVRIAPRRFNPTHTAWLPVLHTTRGRRHYTALFSNTARAHALHKTADWVVLYVEGQRADSQFTVITAEFGPMAGLRVVRGREAECLARYRRRHAS